MNEPTFRHNIPQEILSPMSYPHSGSMFEQGKKADVAINTHGFSALPDELYLEILSCLPALPIPHDVWVGHKPDPYRQLTLYSLSQTCQSMRRFFLRYAWERIEVFGGMWTPNGRLMKSKHILKSETAGDKNLVEEIHRQLETVLIRNPDLRQYVTTVNLTLLRYSHKSVILTIAQTLSFLPNLNILQLIFRVDYSNTRSVFAGFHYPSIHTLNLSAWSPIKDILRACPNTRQLSFYKDLGQWYFLRRWFADQSMGNIEILGVISRLDLPAIVKCLPRLRDISLQREYLRRFSDTVNCLSSLPLHTIRLRLDNWGQLPYADDAPATMEERQNWIDLAKGILDQCPQDGVAKKVVVVNDDNTVGVHPLNRICL